MKYFPTIGLEIHAELKTRTKMFCGCANNPDESRPNVNICPICLAHPGTLPVINRAAVKHMMRVGTAIKGSIADFSEFDRKSYFYPDIPKGYQISQYKYPLVAGGELAGVAVTRVHLEEDTARSIHTSGESLIDFNRAGIPLMELVTEPVIHDAETAGRFARELQLLLRTLGASDANLEKGEMRIEANISVSADENILGTKVEVKNINSFHSVERAISFEIKRQIAVIEEGKDTIIQATRGWNDSTQKTFHQRVKEGSADYRYFPEPDLPKLYISEIAEFSKEVIQRELPELPENRRARYIETYSIKESDADYLVATHKRASFFDALTKALDGDNTNKLVKIATNYIVSDLAGIYAKKGSEEYDKLDPKTFAKLISLVSLGELSSRGAKDTLLILVNDGGEPEEIAKKHNLIQVHNTDVLKEAIHNVLKEEAKAVDEYKAGKDAALQYLVGKSMKATKGAGNPTLLKSILIEELK